jgi:prepilin-type N-terminal cleavage/methylation domain-containing protein
MQKKGFTLVELLVVIGILAILTAAVVVVLNPAELLRQSRDAQRLSDFDAIRSAISLYLSTALVPIFTATECNYMYTGCFDMTIASSSNTSTAIDGTGWVAVNFNDLATSSVGLGSPLSALPTDPVNNASYHYAASFDATNKYYELNSVLESSKYSGKMSTDGGSSPTVYEVGNKLTL